MNCLFCSRQVMAILCSFFNAIFWVELPKSCRETSSNIADTLSVTIAATFITFTPTCIRGKFESLVNWYPRNKLTDMFGFLTQWEFCVRFVRINQKNGVKVAGALSPLRFASTKSACFAGYVWGCLLVNSGQTFLPGDALQDPGRSGLASCEGLSKLRQPNCHLYWWLFGGNMACSNVL